MGKAAEVEKTTKDFTRGYYCAVATLLRMHGMPTTDVRELFPGCNPALADAEDKELFIEHKLMEK